MQARRGLNQSSGFDFLGTIGPALLESIEIGHSAGMVVVACHPRSKIPAAPWSHLRRVPHNTATLWSQFSAVKQNAAAVMGAPSGHLAVIDFDDAVVYRQWAEANPEWAARIPTVKTERGFHLWFRLRPRHRRAIRELLRCPTKKRAAGHIDLPYGELRADSGCLSTLPGSTHESGHIYAWADGWKHAPPQRLTDYPWVNPMACGLIQADGASDATSKPRQVELPEFGSVGGVELETIEDAYAASLPDRPGERNACVFLFARMLKAFSEVRDMEPDRLELFVRQWHSMAIRRCRTKRWETTWADFRRAWARCKPYGTGSLADAAAYAQGDTQLELPEIYRELTDQERAVLKCCLHLQHQRGDRPMFLAVRDAARVAGVSVTTGHRILHRLAELGLLTVHRTGKLGNRHRPHSGRATEYIVNGKVRELKPVKVDTRVQFDEPGKVVKEPQETLAFQGVKHRPRAWVPPEPREDRPRDPVAIPGRPPDLRLVALAGLTKPTRCVPTTTSPTLNQTTKAYDVHHA